MCAEQELDHRGAATAQIVFGTRGIQRTGGFFGSVNKLETQEGNENHFRPTWKCPCFLDQKLPPKNNPETILHGAFEIQSWEGLKYSVNAFFVVAFMARFALRTLKFLTYINSWDQKGCIQRYWGSQPLAMQEHLQSPFKGCSRRRRSKVTKKWKQKLLKAGRVLNSELDCRPPETPFQPKLFYENILFHWQPEVCIFTDWERR